VIVHLERWLYYLQRQRQHRAHIEHGKR
jgi:hypothetical protein